MDNTEYLTTPKSAKRISCSFEAHLRSFLQQGFPAMNCYRSCSHPFKKQLKLDTRPVVTTNAILNETMAHVTFEKLSSQDWYLSGQEERVLGDLVIYKRRLTAQPMRSMWWRHDGVMVSATRTNGFGAAVLD